jgi:glycosyltransferase involved in cell wall biosynthesis
MSNILLLSILTPTFNRANYIVDAIESVLSQDYSNFEHIIVDGQSTDTTLEVLARYPHLKMISEPDSGMYDALNKGLKMAQGDVIGWVNSDDLFLPGVFTDVMALFTADPQLEAVVGGATFFSGSKDNPTIIRTIPWIEAGELIPRLTRNSPVTNGWFFRRSVFDKVGGFDSSCLYAGDGDFLLRMAFAGINYRPLRKVVYSYRIHSGSFTINSLDSRDPTRGKVRIKVLTEQIMVIERFLTNANTPTVALPLLQRKHSEQTYRLAATAFYHQQWQIAKRAVFQGCKHNAAWPIFFIWMALSRLFMKSASYRQD